MSGYIYMLGAHACAQRSVSYLNIPVGRNVIVCRESLASRKSPPFSALVDITEVASALAGVTWPGFECAVHWVTSIFTSRLCDI